MFGFAAAVLGCFAPVVAIGQAGIPAGDGSELRSLGIFVTIQRLTQMTDSGLQAIPQGALVSVVENPAGQKYAVFRQTRIPISNLNVLSNDPARIAASSASGTGPGTPKAAVLSPGTSMRDGQGVSPQSTSQEQIKLDDSGRVISRMKTTVISDGSGNSTTITQGRASGMTPERAAKLATARVKMQEQREAIATLKLKRGQGNIVTGYEAKLKQMNDLLLRMEAEYARMQAEYNQ